MDKTIEFIKQKQYEVIMNAKMEFLLAHKNEITQECKKAGLSEVKTQLMLKILEAQTGFVIGGLLSSKYLDHQIHFDLIFKGYIEKKQYTEFFPQINELTDSQVQTSLNSMLWDFAFAADIQRSVLSKKGEPLTIDGMLTLTKQFDESTATLIQHTAIWKDLVFNAHYSSQPFYALLCALHQLNTNGAHNLQLKPVFNTFRGNNLTDKAKAFFEKPENVSAFIDTVSKRCEYCNNDDIIHNLNNHGTLDRTWGQYFSEWKTWAFGDSGTIGDTAQLEQHSELHASTALTTQDT